MNYLFFIIFFISGCAQLELNPCPALNKAECNEASGLKVKQNPSLDREILQHQPNSADK